MRESPTAKTDNNEKVYQRALRGLRWRKDLKDYPFSDQYKKRDHVFSSPKNNGRINANLYRSQTFLPRQRWYREQYTDPLYLDSITPLSTTRSWGRGAVSINLESGCRLRDRCTTLAKQQNQHLANNWTGISQTGSLSIPNNLSDRGKQNRVLQLSCIHRSCLPSQRNQLLNCGFLGSSERGQMYSSGKTPFTDLSAQSQGVLAQHREYNQTLYSVDQIREQESPWKALTEIASHRTRRRSSPFKRRLQERKKVRMLYGNLASKTLNRYLKDSYRPEDLLIALECRLDIVLKRSALFPSIQSARQSILQSGISVNGTIVSCPRYNCTPGDYIQVLQRCFDGSLSSRQAIQSKIDQKSCQGEQTMQKPALPSFSGQAQHLFAFSQLLQLFHKKTGRLYTSVPLPCYTTRVSEKIDSLATRRIDQRYRLFAEKLSTFASKAQFNRPAQGQQSYRNTITSDSIEIKTNKNSLPARTSTALSSNTLLSLSIADQAELVRSSSRTIASRPAHLEVSYRNLSVVFLYSPQRVCLDISIDLSMLF